MPNGLQGTKEQWNQLEAPLLEIDDNLKLFAQKRNLNISKNYHNCPNRRIKWGRNICKLIEISLKNKKQMTFSFSIYAWQDRQEGRYWKHKILKEEISFSKIKDNINQLLEEGYKILESWTENDLRITI